MNTGLTSGSDGDIKLFGLVLFSLSLFEGFCWMLLPFKITLKTQIPLTTDIRVCGNLVGILGYSESIMQML